MSTSANPVSSQPARSASSLGRSLSLALNKLIVSIYRTFGFIVLTLILLGLVSFLFTKLFFLFNRSWISPTLLSPTDERIVRLNAEIVQQSTLRDKLLVERGALEVNLKDAQRRTSTGASLSQALTLAARNEAKIRHTERRRLLQLSSTLDEVRNQVSDASRQFGNISRKSLDEQYQAGLTTQDRYVSGGLQLGQLAQANLALAEKASDLEARGVQLKRDADALVSAIVAPNPKNGRLNIDSLRLRQDFMRGALDVARAQDEIKAYTEALKTTDRSIDRYSELLKVLSEAPLLKALSGNITIAFVPYENLTNVHNGSAVFSCRVGMFGCRKVGQVNQILSGEVSVHSPVDTKNERGLMLELALQGADHAGQDQVLFLNHAPLFF